MAACLRGLTPEAIAPVRALTAKPFAINLWVSTADDVSGADGAAFERAVATLAPHFRAADAPLPRYQSVTPMSFEAQVRAVLEARVPVFSFTCGIPPAAVMEECRARAIRTLGTATTPDEATASMPRASAMPPAADLARQARRAHRPAAAVGGPERRARAWRGCTVSVGGLSIFYREAGPRNAPTILLRPSSAA